MAQVVKNPPTMQETWVQYLGWEDPQEKGKATQPNNPEPKAPGLSPLTCPLEASKLDGSQGLGI